MEMGVGKTDGVTEMVRNQYPLESYDSKLQLCRLLIHYYNCVVEFQ